MTTEADDSRLLDDWSIAAQGDIIGLTQLGYWTGNSHEALELVETPGGVALISQTCDLVQVSTKPRVLVAPIVEADPSESSQIRKGRRPLRVLVGSELNKVADLERITSVPREMLTGKPILDKTSDTQSGKKAAELAERVARGFSRFAFPDEVHAALRKFQRKISDGYNRSSYFAEVLAKVEEFRVACSDWNRPAREITIYAIVSTEYLPDWESMPSDWNWSPDTVVGVKRGGQLQDFDLEGLSELILANAESQNDPALLTLWPQWGEVLHAGWLDYSDPEVDSIELEIVSMVDFTYDMYVTTEALDFSVLSHTGI